MPEIYIYNEITTSTAAEMVNFLKESGKTLTVHVNSLGGDVYAALAIYNLIKNRQVTIQIDGVAASAATLIMCGGYVKAAENALIMVHQPLVELHDYFNSQELSELERTLRVAENSIIQTYAAKTGKTAAELSELLKTETWLNATEAKELNLVDEITSGSEMTNSLLKAKFEASVVAAERGRIAKLTALKNENEAVNALVEVALQTGDTAEKLKPYLEAVQKLPLKNLNELYELIESNVKSGAEGVTGSVGCNDTAEKIAKYTNEYLKGGVGFGQV